MRGKIWLSAPLLTVLATNPAGAFSIHEAINQAIQTYPSIGEAGANRRATEAEMRQVQSTLLPQVRLEARVGPERFTQNVAIPPAVNGKWQDGRTVSVVARQLLFDGLTSINEVWRQAARVDAAAYRVRERTELVALDAAEAYIDVVRYLRLITLAQENLAKHQKIFADVQARFQGGRSGEGDVQQARERVAGAEAILAQFRQSLDDARGAFRKSVGLEPHNLRFPGRLPGLPRTKDESLAVTLRNNPTLQAARSDAEAAKYGFRATSGAFLPTVTLEGRALYGRDSDNYLGDRHQESLKVVASWDIFRGGQDTWRRAEMSERYIEQSVRSARLQRDAFESIDKAWAARTITSDRITALVRQVEAARRAAAAYAKEYELGQRSLIDLLNAENTRFNALVSLVSTRSVAVFADYQLLAAMGKVLEYLKSPAPADAEPLEVKPLGPFPYKLPPIIVKDPKPGPEPLNVVAPELPPARTAFAAEPPKVITFSERWSHPSNLRISHDVKSWMPDARKEAAMAFAAPSQNIFVPGGVQGLEMVPIPVQVR